MSHNRLVFFPTPSQKRKTGIEPGSQPLFLQSSKRKTRETQYHPNRTKSRPLSLVNPTPLQTRLGTPIRAGANGRDLALDIVAGEILSERRVDEFIWEAVGEHLPNVHSTRVI